MKNIKAIFEASFHRTLGSHSFNNNFIDRFYENLFKQSEEIADLFKNTNMSAQRTMLHDSLNLMVEYYHSKELPIGMKKIAEVHSRKGRAIPEKMYEIWLASLIKTLKEVDPGFNDDVEQAWREVLAPGIDFMKAQY